MEKFPKNENNGYERASFFDELPYWSAPFGQKLLEYIDYKPGITVLDIGFGTGFPLIELAMRLGESSIVYGIDPWKEAIKRAEQKISFYGVRNIRIIEGIAESIPLSDNTLDLIVSNNGINNAGSIEKVFSECSRTLKSRGQFVMTMNLDKTMFEFYDQLEKVLSELNMTREISLMYEHIYNKRRPLDEVIRLLKSSGFQIRNLVSDQFNYKFTDARTLFSHHFIRSAFMDSWKKLLPEDKIDLVFNKVESGLDKESYRSGGLKITIPFAMIDSFKED